MGLIENPLQEAIALTHKAQSIKAHKKVHMGLSWFIEEKKWSKYRLIHHGGTTMGFHTYFGFIKEEKIGIVMFSTIQLTTFRLVRMLLQLTGLINENIAETIFKDYVGSK